MGNKYRTKRFTLLEMLVSMTIIAICFTVILSAISQNIKNTSIAEGYTTAALLAKGKLAEINNSDSLEEGEEEGDFDDTNYPGFKWKKEIKLIEDVKDPDQTFEYVKSDDLISDDSSSSSDDSKNKKSLYRVILYIIFSKGNQERKVKFETVLNKSFGKSEEARS